MSEQDGFRSSKPEFSVFLERWSRVDVVAHEQERAAREEYSIAMINWQSDEIDRLEKEVQRLREFEWMYKDLCK